jgi:hypothetical protein
LLEVFGGNDLRVWAGDPDAFRGGGRGQRVITGDHNDADARSPAFRDGLYDACPRRVEHGD